MEQVDKYEIVFQDHRRALFRTTAKVSTAPNAEHAFVAALKSGVDTFEKNNLDKIKTGRMPMADRVQVTLPNGQVKTLFKDQLKALLEKDKQDKGQERIYPTTDDQIVITLEDATTRKTVCTIMSVNLGLLTDDDFQRVQSLVQRLQNGGGETDGERMRGASIRCVRMGTWGTSLRKMKLIHETPPMVAPPRLVRELEDVLKFYAPSSSVTGKKLVDSCKHSR